MYILDLWDLLLELTPETNVFVFYVMFFYFLIFILGVLNLLLQ